MDNNLVGMKVNQEYQFPKKKKQRKRLMRKDN